MPDHLTIQLREHRGYLFAPARINGRGAGLFMFDTGSNLAVISTGVAGRLGLEVVGNSHAVGVGGTQAFDYRGYSRLEFGGLEVSSDRAAAISLHPMSNGIGTSVSGLIGIRELGGLPFTLDYSDHTLTVYRRHIHPRQMLNRNAPGSISPAFPWSRRRSGMGTLSG
ncbi:MAG: retropepsin-like aspartic protease [Phycisphaerales bacterium]